MDEGLSVEEAIRVNEKCQQVDGIDSIDENGTVTFSEPEMSIMSKLLGYRCARMQLADAADWAAELGRKYQRYASQFKRLDA